MMKMGWHIMKVQTHSGFKMMRMGLHFAKVQTHSGSKDDEWVCDL